MTNQTPDDSAITGGTGAAGGSTGGGDVFPPDAVTPAPIPTDYTDSGVPNLDFVRDRIEGRLARAEGSTELAAGGDEARAFAEQAAAREKAAAEKLAEIRRSLGRDG